jgi:hypothetical protein
VHAYSISKELNAIWLNLRFRCLTSRTRHGGEQKNPKLFGFGLRSVLC